jgi:hypothetical protein
MNEIFSTSANVRQIAGRRHFAGTLIPANIQHVADAPRNPSHPLARSVPGQLFRRQRQPHLIDIRNVPE